MARRERNTDVDRVIDGLALILPWPVLLFVSGVVMIAWAASELAGRVRRMSEEHP